MADAMLKAGLEIHQQLDCGKLFCACPGYLRQDEPHYTIMRTLHPVVGETGEVDAAVAYEASLGKTFYYQGYRDSVCLVEQDEEPPHLLNEKALWEAVKIALLLHCELYPVSQIMRKMVIDGSNTSGFQRTDVAALHPAQLNIPNPDSPDNKTSYQERPHTLPQHQLLPSPPQPDAMSA